MCKCVLCKNLKSRLQSTILFVMIVRYEGPSTIFVSIMTVYFCQCFCIVRHQMVGLIQISVERFSILNEACKFWIFLVMYPLLTNCHNVAITWTNWAKAYQSLFLTRFDHPFPRPFWTMLKNFTIGKLGHPLPSQSLFLTRLNMDLTSPLPLVKNVKKTARLRLPLPCQSLFLTRLNAISDNAWQLQDKKCPPKPYTASLPIFLNLGCQTTPHAYFQIYGCCHNYLDP